MDCFQDWQAPGCLGASWEHGSLLTSESLKTRSSSVDCKNHFFLLSGSPKTQKHIDEHIRFPDSENTDVINQSEYNNLYLFFAFTKRVKDKAYTTPNVINVVIN